MNKLQFQRQRPKMNALLKSEKEGLLKECELVNTEAGGDGVRARRVLGEEEGAEAARGGARGEGTWCCRTAR